MHPVNETAKEVTESRGILEGDVVREQHGHEIGSNVVEEGERITRRRRSSSGCSPSRGRPLRYCRAPAPGTSNQQMSTSVTFIAAGFNHFISSNETPELYQPSPKGATSNGSV
jgi:hypothetical protein